MDTAPKPLVIDTSIAIKWLFLEDEAATTKARQLLLKIEAGSYLAYAPILQKYELGNVLHKSKKITEHELNTYLEFLENFPISYLAETPNLSKTTHELCFKHSITYYDASYLALAIELNAIIVSSDQKFISAVNDEKLIIELNQLNLK
jgi:predicted nucleic acid-binding protein